MSLEVWVEENKRNNFFASQKLLPGMAIVKLLYQKSCIF